MHDTTIKTSARAHLSIGSRLTQQLKGTVTDQSTKPLKFKFIYCWASQDSLVFSKDPLLKKKIVLLKHELCLRLR